MKILVMVLGLAAAVGCAPQNSFSPLRNGTTSAVDNLTNGTAAAPGARPSAPASSATAPDVVAPGPPKASSGSSAGHSAGNSSTSSGAPAFQICSKLPFSTSVTFPSSMTLTDAEAFKLALNLSGSFEGTTGWANLTNNFDGEGLSMGLLNQTLGTGSLEPLFSEMRKQHLAALENAMEASRAKSLVAMIDAWSTKAMVEAEMVRAPANADVSSGDGPLSALDIGAPDSENDAAPTESALTESLANPVLSERQARVLAAPLISRDTVAASWARANLYAPNGKFLAGWSSDLTRFANTPEYVSIQLSAAATLFLEISSARIADRLQRSALFSFDV